MENLRKIRIFSKVVKTGKGRTFDSYFTKVNIVVTGEEEKGKQQKWITIKFRKDVDVKDIKNGYLFCTDDQINAPIKYTIYEDENGEIKYPEIWIRGFEKYEPVKKQKINYKSYFVDDEDETSETPIDDIVDEELPF